MKNTKIAERHIVQFRAEFFDAFNHPQFNNPNNTGGFLQNQIPDRSSGNFGQITTTSVNPRVIQLALKYMF